MRETILGRTGFNVSVLGLGAGGPSRIGQTYDATEVESIRLVREAVDLGITFFDTAEAYRTESHIGRGIADFPKPDTLVVSTKISPTTDRGIKTPREIEESLDASLKKLGRERAEVYHVHGVKPELYADVRDRVYPVLVRMRDKGKIHAIGITEHFGTDSNHRMLTQALNDDLWDVIMIGFNVLNPSARPLLEQAKRQNVGVLDMFAVRRAFRSESELAEYVENLIADSVVDRDMYEQLRPFAQSIETGECATMSELAYRFCLFEPGIDVVLSGTGSISHLRENRKTADRPSLSDETLSRLERVFGAIDSVSGN